MTYFLHDIPLFVLYIIESKLAKSGIYIYPPIPITISVLVLVFVVYNRRREAQIKYPNPDDDVRENIINYEDEGGGEDDMTAFDITPLQIPVAAPDAAAAAAAMSTLQRQKMKSCELPSIRFCCIGICE